MVCTFLIEIDVAIQHVCAFDIPQGKGCRQWITTKNREGTPRRLRWRNGSGYSTYYKRDQKPSDEEVKRAYRALAKKYHPDMNPGDAHAAEMMNKINAAYDQIKNPQPRTNTQQRQYQDDPFAG